MLTLGVPDPIPGRGLARYDAARQALAEAHDLDEVKDIRDKAEAMRAYARQAQDLDLMRWSAEIKLRAERRAGEMLGEMEKHPGGRPTQNRSHDATSLKDIGINKNQSANWQASASMPEADFEAYLAGHTGERMPSSSALRNLLKIKAAKQRNADETGCTIDDLEALAFERPNAFAAILVDVPWKYENHTEAGGGRAPDLHYPTMTLEEIMAMGPLVRALAAPDCALFYWTSGPHLENTLMILDVWGESGDAMNPIFRYSTKAFCWAKENSSGQGWHMGTGFWTRANTEDCLLFLKGHPTRLNQDVRQLITEPVGVHSAKPQEVHARIERLVGGPYLELFAREAREGWTVWGNEAGGPGQCKAEDTQP